MDQAEKRMRGEAEPNSELVEIFGSDNIVRAIKSARLVRMMMIDFVFLDKKVDE